MIRRALLLLALSAGFGLFFATLLETPTLLAGDAPSELSEEPARPSARSKEFSRPFIEATARVRPAVVKIRNFQRFGRRQAQSSGSGVIISREGHILTNRHVILNAHQVVVELIDGRRFQKVEILGMDRRSDLAVIRITDPAADELPVAVLGDSDELDVGEWVIAIGAPFELASSVSTGIVSATGRTGVLGTDTSEEFIQTDAALNPGNSGGPLINLDGQIVGINTAIETGGQIRASVGVGFAIPINLARTIAISLIERGVAKRGWLGIQGSPAGPSLLKEKGIASQGGFVIDRVAPESPAAKAGLQPGDVVTAVDGRALLDLRIFHARLAQAGPGGTLGLTVHRASNEREVKIVLGEEPVYSYGIEVEDLDRKKAAALGLPKDTSGVVVTRIQENSVAARESMNNRLMPGDVIQLVEWPNRREAVSDKTDFDRIMTRFRVGPPRVIRFKILTREGWSQIYLRPYGS